MSENQKKLDFLYALSAQVNEVAVVADRKGCGEVGQLVLGIMDAVAAELGLPPNYREEADDWRLANEGLEELMNEWPET